MSIYRERQAHLVPGLIDDARKEEPWLAGAQTCWQQVDWLINLLSDQLNSKMTSTSYFRPLSFSKSRLALNFFRWVDPDFLFYLGFFLGL